MEKSPYLIHISYLLRLVNNLLDLAAAFGGTPYQLRLQLRWLYFEFKVQLKVQMREHETKIGRFFQRRQNIFDLAVTGHGSLSNAVITRSTFRLEGSSVIGS